MSHNHLSGQNFDVMIGDILVHVLSMSASISDNRQAVGTRGVPDGYVDGDVSCTGEIELDAKNFALLTTAAKAAGSWRDLKPFDVNCVGESVSEKQKLELFGCLFKISDVFNLDPKGGDKQKHKLPFDVTDPDFVRIDGVPYLSERDTRDL
jgi:hypothetical protein